MSAHSGLNADVVKASLDKVVFDEFDREDMGGSEGEVFASDELFFRQENTGMGVIQYAEHASVNEFKDTDEEESLEEDTTQTGNKTAKTVSKYAKTLPVSKELFDDDQHGTIRYAVEEMGRKARQTQDHQAMNKSYGDAFSGVTTPDGAALISNSHTTINGDTVDNLETGTLTADNLFTVAKSLRLQKDQRGEAGGHRPNGLLVPVALHQEAIEITDSELKAGTGNNELNYWSNIYPGLRVGASAFLDSTYNSANSNADTSYFVVGRNHHVTRTVRAPFQTAIVDYVFDDQQRYKYRGWFREIVAAQSWTGVVGSNGTV